MNPIRKVTLIALLLILIMLSSVGLSDLVTRVQALTLYDSGDPTSTEQLVLEMVNRARANPTAEGTRLGIDLSSCALDTHGTWNPSLVKVSPPLAMNRILLDYTTASLPSGAPAGSARFHNWDMVTNSFFGHTDTYYGTAWNRMTAFGYNWVSAGENIAAYGSPTTAEDELMIDSGTDGCGHRANLFGAYREVGIGWLATAGYLTQDFGSTSVGPFLVGVVYDDKNSNNFYDTGEGISGVTITPSPDVGYDAVSSTSGGYAIPIGTSGTITVTASGPGFGTVTTTVTLTGANIKLDFKKPPVIGFSGWSLLDGGGTLDAVGLDAWPFVLMAARSTDNSMWYRLGNSAIWLPWYQIPGYTDARIGVAWWNSKFYFVAKEYGKYTVWYSSVTGAGGTFSGWKPLDGGGTPAAVSVASDSSYLYVAAEALDGTIWWRRMDQSEHWSGWSQIPGYTDASPAIAVFQDALFFVCKEKSTMNIWWSYLSTTGAYGWSGWRPLDGPTPSAVSLTASSISSYLYLAARAPDNTIWYRSMHWVTVGGVAVPIWSGWTQIPGYTDVSPSTVFFRYDPGTTSGEALYFVCKESGATRIWWGYEYGVTF